jgi:AraC-like DNA-binding protein
MLYHFNFYSALLLIFFFNGGLYGILLLRKGIQNENKSAKWLSLFIGLCTLYIAPWMLGFAGWYDAQPYRDILFYTPFQHLYFIGPIIFFYTQSLLNPHFKFSKKEWLHLIPGFIYLVYNLVIFIVDKIFLKQYYFYANGADKDFETWYQWSGLVSMLFYFTISIRYFSIYKKLMQQVISYADTLLFKWVRNFLYAFLGMQILQILFYVLFKIYPEMNNYVGSWWYFLSFSVLMFYIAIAGYSNNIETAIPFKLKLIGHQPVYLLNAPSDATETAIIVDAIEIESIPIQNYGIEDIDIWKSRIKALLDAKKVYEDPELSLSQVAQLLESNPTFISKVINQGFQMNFNDLINHYRINAVKEKFQQGLHKKQTLLAIALDCGFNSKATFNRAFKKISGLSPKAFLENI